MEGFLTLFNNRVNFKQVNWAMPKFIFICLLFYLSAVSAYGQQLLKGRVLENKTRVSLTGINITNLNTKQTTLSDNKGNFTIKASLNDILLFKGFAYQNDTLVITKLNNFEVFMLPQEHMLKDVKVTSMDGPSMAIYDPYFHGQTTAYQTDKNGNFKGGVNFRFWYWKKDEHKREKLKKMQRDEQTYVEIAKAFSAKNVTNFVPLKGAELDNFTRMYTPSLKVYTANTFNLTDYLNACYKKFMLLPTQKRQIIADSTVFNQ
jgi:hypothetical protein